jgi:hypothetical protein
MDMIFTPVSSVVGASSAKVCKTYCASEITHDSASSSYYTF